MVQNNTFFNGENERTTDFNENHISCEEHLIICSKKVLFNSVDYLGEQLFHLEC
jgi:hypothetical protein